MPRQKRSRTTATTTDRKAKQRGESAQRRAANKASAQKAQARQAKKAKVEGRIEAAMDAAKRGKEAKAGLGGLIRESRKRQGKKKKVRSFTNVPKSKKKS